MKTVVVTGHLGFIGRHLWAALGAARRIGLDLREGSDVLACELPECDECFHLAAQTDARSADALADARTNILGSIRIFDRYRGRCVFASSSSVNYPTSPYAISKLAAEHYARLHDARVVRLCNVHGPGSHSVVEKFAQAGVLEIAGDGTQLRTYAHVGDAVRALLGARAPLTVLCGEVLSVNDLADRHPGKPRVRVPRSEHDAADARQLIAATCTGS